MTIRALVGLTAFNVYLAGFGTALLFALRQSTTRREAVRLVGVSYLLGAAVLMVLLTLLIVLGIPVNTVSIVLITVVVTLFAIWLVRRRQPPSPSERDEPSWRLLSIGSAGVFAAIVIALEAVFRKGRLQGLLEFDSWDSWGPKAKALYHFGRLDPSFLDGLPGGSYPPGLPALLSGALHAIGSADMVTVHLQYWFLGLGFLAALVGVLATRVTPLLLLPFVLLVYVMPDIRNRSVDMYGDLPLGLLIATGAVLLALWLERRERWHLPAAALLFAGAALTKREGVILAACVVLAALVASADRIRADWPRLVAVLSAPVAATLVWQIWISGHDLPGNGPQGGLSFLGDLGRGWDAFDVVTNNLFNFDLWLLSLTIAIAAVGLTLLVKAWRTAAYAGSLLVLLILACTVILWSDTNLQLDDVNVVSRLVGTVSLVAVAITPRVLQRAWAAGETKRAHVAGRAPAWRIGLRWAIVTAAAVIYPATLLADDGARFPKASDCVVAPSEGDQVLVVFGHVPSYPRALLLRKTLAEFGIDGVELAQDGCGQVRVFRAAGELRVAEELVRQLAGHGFPAQLEAKPSS